MIVYTGDIHGDITKIENYITTRRQHGLEDPNAIVILGDVGLNYYLDYRDEALKRKLDNLDVDILCLHGNHEARPETIDSYVLDVYNNGEVMIETRFPHLKFLEDGEVYDLDGRRTLAIGGAYSVDKYYRLLNNMAWFNDEQPSHEIKQKVEHYLSRHGWKVDQIISHTCPAKFTPTEMFLPGVDQSTVDTSTEKWLDRIEDKTKYDRWLCGHWHCDKHENDKFQFVFNNFIM